MSEGLGFTSDPKVVKLIVRSVIEHQRRADNTYENVVMYGSEEAHGAPLNPGDKVSDQTSRTRTREPNLNLDMTITLPDTQEQELKV